MILARIIQAEKSAFTLLASGGFAMSSKADKLAAKALVDQINTAVASKDASALQTAYAQLIKLSAIEEGLAGGETQ
eukprot:6603-Heterococcus_DN1.PRE.2